MSWLDQSAIRSSIGAEGSAALRFFGPPIHFLGGGHRFYPLKGNKKTKVRRASGAPRTSTCRTWQAKDGAGGRQGRACTARLCKDTGTRAVEHSVQLLLSCRARPDVGKPDTRGHPRHHPASCTLGFRRRSCCSNYARPPSPFRNSSAFSPSRSLPSGNCSPTSPFTKEELNGIWPVFTLFPSLTWSLWSVLATFRLLSQ